MTLDDISRRGFLKCSACALAVTAITPACTKAAAAPQQKAMFWSPTENGGVGCELCPRQCYIEQSKRGYCHARENRSGILYSVVYSRLVTIHNDPIEKKPLFHVLPGSNAYSVATAGCNLSCKHCQNWEISQSTPEQLPAQYIAPEQLIESAISAGSKAVAFTYNEPTTQIEYVLATSKKAKAAGLAPCIISNGYIREKPQQALFDVLKAYKIDLKAFTEDFYGKICNGSLRHVKESIVRVSKSKVWLEIVNLMIPTLNDADKEIDEMTKWIAGEIGTEVPLHFTRFHPTYQIQNLPPTPVSTLEKAREIAMKNGIRFAYVGNVPGHPGEHTYCPQCNKMLISRIGFVSKIVGMNQGKCSNCGRQIPGVWA